jgi:hypothetical protein
MKETSQQYLGRILGNLRKASPMAVQAATPKRLERLIRGVPAARLSKRPAPDKWSVGEILAHMAEAEMAGSYRMRSALGESGTPILAFDQDKWAAAGRYSKRQPKHSLATFRALREENLRLLRSLKPAEWRRYGMHQERGRETIERMARMFAGHDLNHIRQIESILDKRA